MACRHHIFLIISFALSSVVQCQSPPDNESSSTEAVDSSSTTEGSLSENPIVTTESGSSTEEVSSSVTEESLSESTTMVTTEAASTAGEVSSTVTEGSLSEPTMATSDAGCEGAVVDQTYGCSNEYCWAKCEALGKMAGQPARCFTTKSKNSPDYNFVKCKGHGDCSACWKCGGLLYDFNCRGSG